MKIVHLALAASLLGITASAAFAQAQPGNSNNGNNQLSCTASSTKPCPDKPGLMRRLRAAPSRVPTRLTTRLLRMAAERVHWLAAAVLGLRALVVLAV